MPPNEIVAKWDKFHALSARYLVINGEMKRLVPCSVDLCGDQSDNKPLDREREIACTVISLIFKIT